jgi:hypothetical protein
MEYLPLKSRSFSLILTVLASAEKRKNKIVMPKLDISLATTPIYYLVDYSGVFSDLFERIYYLAPTILVAQNSS